MSTMNTSDEKKSKIISSHGINGSKKTHSFDQDDEFHDAHCSMNTDEPSKSTERIHQNGCDNKNPIQTKQKPQINEERKKSSATPESTFLSKFTTWANSTYHTEVTLRFAQYLIWFFSEVFSSEGLRDIYSQLNNTRFVLRFFGIPLSMHAIKSGSWSSGWSDNRIHKLTDIMAWSMLFYYPLEHVAFTKWVSPKLIRANAERYSALSCRFWCLYIISDFGSVIFKLKELNKKRLNVLMMKKEHKIKDEDAEKTLSSIRGMVKYNKLHALRCILFVLPCINWSLPKWERDPWLKSRVVNSLMLSESIVCLYQQISNIP